jgi:hypothetical protein
MAPTKPIEAKRKKYFSVDEANKTLPLVRMIVTDIVRQFRTVTELKQRLTAITAGRKPTSPDPYSEELAQSQADLEAEKEKLQGYIEELERLGVQLKGPDGLCDFPSVMDGREVCLCWRLGEPEVQYWHETFAGFAGRQPLSSRAGSRRGDRSL